MGFGDRQYLRFGLAKTMARGRIDDEKVSTSAGVATVTDGPEPGRCSGPAAAAIPG
jgi:hypothetical protein